VWCVVCHVRAAPLSNPGGKKRRDGHVVRAAGAAAAACVSRFTQQTITRGIRRLRLKECVRERHAATPRAAAPTAKLLRGMAAGEQELEGVQRDATG